MRASIFCVVPTALTTSEQRKTAWTSMSPASGRHFWWLHGVSAPRAAPRDEQFPHGINNPPHAERVSVMSSGLPWLAVSQDGVEDDDELAHAGDERLLAGFAGGSELGVVRGDDRVGAAGDQGGHVEAGTAAAQRAAVAVDRGDADQC